MTRRTALCAVALGCLALVGCGKTLQAYPDELAGVGLVLETQSGGIVVRDVVAGGPASEAGLAQGDRIVEVDGETTTGRALASVVGALRGRAGSKVALRVANARGQAVVTLTRRVLKRTDDGYHTTVQN